MTDSATSPAALAETCRALADAATRLESRTMAEWGRVLDDGRSARDMCAEAAGLAWRIERATSRDTAPVDDRTDRHRRPVAVLLRELRECLTRAAVQLGAMRDGAIPSTVRQDVARVRGFVAVLE